MSLKAYCVTAVLIYVVLLFLSASAPRPWLRDTAPLQHRIEKLEKRIEYLEAAAPPKDGEIKVFRVDSVAGIVECKSCRYVQDEAGNAIR